MYSETPAGSYALSFQPNVRGALPGHRVASRIGGVQLMQVIVSHHVAECSLSLQTPHCLDVFSLRGSPSGVLGSV